MMPSRAREDCSYSVFVSYSRRDDVGGWVTELVAALRREFERSGDRDFRVFFDRSDIRAREEWEAKLRWALREAPVMVVCTSNEYFASDPCLWEFLEHEGRPTAPEEALGLVPVLLEDAHLVDPDEEHARWHARVFRMHGKLDLRGMFSREPETVTPEELAVLVKQLADDLYDQRSRVELLERIPGNVEPGTSRFIGREDELGQLDAALNSYRSVGVVTAVEGFGGIGKTELVRRHAQVYKERYGVGTWQVGAEGFQEMLPLLSKLASALDLSLSEREQADPEEAGRSVRQELLRRTESGQHVMLILDNVDQAALLGADQLQKLPRGRQIHVAVTTRLSEKEIPALSQLAHVKLGGLKTWEAVALLRTFQPDRTGTGQRDFASSDEECAARELAELLGGFTLAVEQAGAYLQTHDDMSVREYLEHLRKHGALAADGMLGEPEKLAILHQQKLLRVIFKDTMSTVEKLCQGSETVLRLAAAMPPDLVPWRWLEALARENAPYIFEETRHQPKGTWGRIVRILEGRGLIARGRYPGVTGRMHRLFGEYLNENNDVILTRVDNYVVARAQHMMLDDCPVPELGEVHALMEALRRPLVRQPEIIDEVAGFFQWCSTGYVERLHETSPEIAAEVLEWHQELSPELQAPSPESRTTSPSHDAAMGKTDKPWEADEAGPTPCAVFVSYSRKDDIGGWVTEFVNRLLQESHQMGERTLRLIFDPTDCRSYEEWQRRSRFALRQSSTMLIFVSKEYFASETCLWEFQEFEGSQPVPSGRPALVPVFLEHAELEDPDEEHQRWFAYVHRQSGADLSEVFSRDAKRPLPAGMTVPVEEVTDILHERCRAMRLWRQTDGDVGPGTTWFVGRRNELEKLESVLASDQRIAVLQGVGGIGKTGLIQRYLWERKARFTGGTWMLPSEGSREMLPLLARLATELPGFMLPKAAEHDPIQAGRSVLQELERRAEEGRRALLVLDSVDQVSLLGADQLGELANTHGLHAVVTTRLGEAEIPEWERLVHVPIGGLSTEDAVALLRALQPDRQRNGQPDFASEDEERAAFELAELLGGFTLAVEQAGVYLKSHEELSVRDYLEHLRQHGALTGGEMLEDEDKNEILHREKLLSVTLDDTMKTLDDLCPGSVEVLKLAAAMPPDLIPWPWLEDLARETVPSVFDETEQHPKGTWRRIRRILERGSLIEEGKYPGDTGRMQRLVAEHLNASKEALSEGVDEYVMARAGRLQGDFSSVPNLWEVEALLEALRLPLVRNPRSFEHLAGFFTKVAPVYIQDSRPAELVEAVLNALPEEPSRARARAASALSDLVRDADPGRALGLAEEALAIARSLLGEMPSNLEARQDLTAALERVTELEMHRDPLRAVALAEESVEIHRVWVEQVPDNHDVRRNLMLSLERLVALLQTVDPQRALHIAEEVLRISRQLTQAMPRNQDTQRDLAKALSTVTELAQYIDPLGALRFAEESLELRRELAASQPESLGARRDLSAALNHLAEMVRHGDPGRGLRLAEESLAISRGLAAWFPGRLDMIQDLGVSLNWVADLATYVDPGRALGLAEEALELRRVLVEAQPESLQARRDLSVSLNKLVDLVGQVDPGRALRLAEESLELARVLVAEHPESLQARRDLTLSLDWVAGLVGQVDPGRALRLAEESLELRRVLVAEQPESLQARRDLSVSLDRVGDLIGQVDPGRALRLAEESLELTRALVAEQPGSLSASRDLTVSLDRVAGLVGDVDPGRALGLAGESLELRRVLVAEQPESLLARRDLSVSLNKVVDLVGQVDPGRALGLAEESLELARVLVAEQPESLLARRDLSVSLNKVVDLVGQVDPGRALGLAEESLELARVLVAEQPGSLLARRDLTLSLDRVGDLVGQVDPGRALGLAEESLKVARVLAEAQPGNVQALWDLGVAAARMALLVPDSPEAGSRWREAAVSFRAALEIRPDHLQLGRLSWESARRYAETGPSDRDEWLAYAAELAERFGLAN